MTKHRAKRSEAILRGGILVGGMKRTLTDVANNIIIVLTPIVILIGRRVLQTLIIAFGICNNAVQNLALPSARRNNAKQLCAAVIRLMFVWMRKMIRLDASQILKGGTFRVPILALAVAM
jgi:hypothetical protein